MMLKQLFRQGNLFAQGVLIVLTAIGLTLLPEARWTVPPGFFRPSPVGSFLHTLALAHPYITLVAANLLIVLNALMLNFLLTRHDLNLRRVWLPAWIYLVLMIIQPATPALTVILMASLLLQFALHSLMSVFGLQNPIMHILNASMLIALSTLFVPYAIIFIPFMWLAFFTLRLNNWREWVVSVLGLVVVLLWVVFHYFWIDGLPALLSNFLSLTGHLRLLYVETNFWLIAMISVLGLLFLVTFLKYINETDEKQIVVRKNMVLLLQFAFILLLLLPFSGTWFVALFPMLYIPFTAFILYLIQQIRPRRLYVDIFVILVIIVLILSRILY